MEIATTLFIKTGTVPFTATGIQCPMRLETLNLWMTKPPKHGWKVSQTVLKLSSVFLANFLKLGQQRNGLHFGFRETCTIGS